MRIAQKVLAALMSLTLALAPAAAVADEATVVGGVAQETNAVVVSPPSADGAATPVVTPVATPVTTPGATETAEVTPTQTEVTPVQAETTPAGDEVTTVQEEVAGVAVQNLDPVEDIVSKMSLDDKLSQMIIVAARTWDGNDVVDLDAASGLAAALRAHAFGGFILYAENVSGNLQTATLVNQLQQNNLLANSTVHVPYFIATDEEGGIVSRLEGGTRMTGSMAIGATGGNAVANAQTTGTVIGEELAALGINLDFAPSVDVNSNPSNPVIGTSSFSDDPARVSQLGAAFAAGLGKSDVIATYKHFPGHGDTTTDTHIDTATVDKTEAQLEQCEFIPFRSVIAGGAEMIMTAHVSLPSYDDQVTLADGTQGVLPATMSKKVVGDLLRTQMGFDGVVISDALEMDAIEKAPVAPGAAGSVEKRANVAEQVINAGCDVLLLPADLGDQSAARFYDEYLAALAAKVNSGAISIARIDQSVARILRLKQAHGFLQAAEPAGDLSTVGSLAHHGQEMAIAQQAVTLVKNTGSVLPFDASGKNVVLIGRTEGDAVALDYAVAILKSKGVIDADARVNNLVDGVKTGSETAASTITIDYAFDSKKGAHFSDGLAAAIADADLVVEVTKTYGLAALAKGQPQYEAVRRPLEATHEADGAFVQISANLPYDAARYQDADAILLAYMGTGTEVNPNEDLPNPGAFNANVIAAVYAVFGDVRVQGTLPVTVPVIEEAADGTLSYSEAALYPRGFGLSYGGLTVVPDDGGVVPTNPVNPADGTDGKLEPVSTEPHTKGSQESLSFRCTASLDGLRGLTVDGVALTESQYLVQGNTIVLVADYLNTLADGSHTLVASLTTNGDAVSAEAKFSTKASEHTRPWASRPAPTPVSTTTSSSYEPSRSYDGYYRPWARRPLSYEFFPYSAWPTIEPLQLQWQPQQTQQLQWLLYGRCCPWMSIWQPAPVRTNTAPRPKEPMPYPYPVSPSVPATDTTPRQDDFPPKQESFIRRDYYYSPTSSANGYGQSGSAPSAGGSLYRDRYY